MNRAYNKRECSKKTNYKETVVNNQKETVNIKTDNKERNRFFIKFKARIFFPIIEKII